MISPITACCVEALGTLVLTLVVFALTDSRNIQVQNSESMKTLTPIIIGFTVSVLISLFAPLTQAGGL